MFILADIKLKMVENQDLYKNRDDFLIFLYKKILFFNVKDFIFYKYVYL